MHSAPRRQMRNNDMVKAGRVRASNVQVAYDITVVTVLPANERRELVSTTPFLDKLHTALDR